MRASTRRDVFEFIAAVADRRKTLTACDPEAGVTATVREHFSDRNVAVEAAESDAGPRNYAALSHGDDVLAAGRTPRRPVPTNADGDRTETRDPCAATACRRRTVGRSNSFR